MGHGFHGYVSHNQRVIINSPIWNTNKNYIIQGIVPNIYFVGRL